ncbi:hypothetical protein dsx2_1534 [Desulfovibrio sp. X2]|uniref:hypothetical protein n=1 Tax=Desulfovibrio sp. X2 TaxID=941449 RepID=UPI0003589D35|nr:hypothetical protein [Desulfovibrio sp. X2]EPR44575.1 hypothetical protein dsx2_1534 [Desulfovibrio sp. X2]
METPGLETATPPQAAPGSGDETGRTVGAGSAEASASASPAQHTAGRQMGPRNVLLDPLGPEDGGEVAENGAGGPSEGAAYAPEDYDFAFPEGFAPDEGLVDSFRGFAAREGIAPGLAARLAAFQAEATLTAQAEWAARCERELRADWGRDYARGVRAAQSAAAYVENRLPGFTAWAGGVAQGSPEFMRFLRWFGDHVAEDSLLQGGAGPRRSEEMTTIAFVTDAFRRAQRGED